MSAPSGSQGTSRRRQTGFTLVELIFATGLIGMLAATATWYWVDTFVLTRAVNGDNASMTEARAALERLAHEIREVKYNQTTGAYCVDTGTGNLTATKLVFNKHHTSGAVVNAQCGGVTPTASANDIAVTIQLTGTNLTLGYAGSLASPATTQTLLASVGGLAMRYLDSAGVVTTSPTALRFVELTLTVRPASAPPTSLKTLVALRNN